VLLFDVAVSFEFEDVFFGTKTTGKGTLAEMSLEMAVKLRGGGGRNVASCSLYLHRTARTSYAKDQLMKRLGSRSEQTFDFIGMHFVY
jgi:hypothetical protein